jgi:hypothetical protein
LRDILTELGEAKIQEMKKKGIVPKGEGHREI